MTREEALKIWLPVIKMGVESMQECNEALDMAIKALEQEPCDDAISRQAVLDLAKFDGRENLGSIIHAFDVEQLPPVVPTEKVGQWIDTEVLDRIRAEIEDLDRYFNNDYFSGNNEPMYKCNEVLQIIDKYKASPTGAERTDKE